MEGAKIADPRKEIELVVRGDDLGFCHTANLAIEKSYKEGILTTAEVMVPAPWFEEATKVAKENPNLDIGVHLVLTSEWRFYSWSPVLPADDVPSLVNDDGYFHPTISSFWEAEPDPEEVEKELEAQIDLAFKKGLNISHLSSHMWAAVSTPELREVVERLAEKHELLVSSKVGEKFWEEKEVPIYEVSPRMKEEALEEILEGLTPGLWLVVVHPGLDTTEMRAMVDENPDGLQNVVEHRAAVTQALTSDRIKGLVEEREIKLVDYRDIER